MIYAFHRFKISGSLCLRLALLGSGISKKLQLANIEIARTNMEYVLYFFSFATRYYKFFGSIVTFMNL